MDSFSDQLHFLSDDDVMLFLSRISLGGGGSSSGGGGEKKSKGHSSLNESISSGTGSFRKCRLCPETFDKTANLK